MARKSPTGQSIPESGVKVQPPQLKPRNRAPMVVSPKVDPSVSMQPTPPLMQELADNLWHRVSLQMNESVAEMRRRRAGLYPARGN